MTKELIERKPTADGKGFISLYKLAGDWSQYATWRSNVETPEDTYWGHYFSNIEDATADYKERD